MFHARNDEAYSCILILQMAPHVPPIELGVASRIERKGPTECWPWTGYKNVYGYGQFYLLGKYHPATRVIWELTNGPIANGLFVLHRCDNPICVNPSHLFLGTQRDNMRDCKAKGRNNRGERNGMHRFTAEQVKEIRRLYETGNDGYMKLGRKLGINRWTIRNLIKNRWRHL